MANLNGRAAGNVGEVVVPLPADHELSEKSAAILASHPPINVLRMFALTDDMLPAVLGMIGALFTAEGIAPHAREIMVLRCAHLLNAPYERQANLVMARNVGLSEEEIDAIGKDGRVRGLDAEGTLICRVTDELTEFATLTDATLQALVDRYGRNVAAKLILAVGWFNLLSRFLNGTRVPLETGNAYEGRTSPI
ncbi:MAG: carboxymuconolactone decarboxylase family protein [Xanthobacteraceae bacterium]|nr:carboxymuconolactone decarboxylase family protein [Xanthobacteraceae bacterium]